MDHDLMATEPGKRLSEDFLTGVFEKRIAFAQRIANNGDGQTAYTWLTVAVHLRSIADYLRLILSEERITKLMESKGVE